jgi:uncharacterized membrane protein YhiD involved in acid resistance
MTISGNLILSLGMVGALSIVRFRTAVKDPVDLAYMFWAITIGIANGVGFYKLSIIGSLFIATVFLLSKTKRHTRSTYVCIIKIKKSDMDSAKKSLSTLLGKYTVRSTQVVDENIELIIQTVKKHNKEIYLTEQLSTCKELTSFQLITYT